MSIADTPGRLYTMGEPASRAADLARNRTFGSGRALPLIPRLDLASTSIRQAYLREMDRGKKGDALPAESKWLTENFRFIKAQIRQVRGLLPQIQREPLPLVTNGPRFGYPRIYEIAIEITDDLAGQVSQDAVASFIEEYQSFAPLTLAELWIVDTMLRFALIEELSRNVQHAPKRSAAVLLSLDKLGSVAWQDFVEASSRTEQILREDPAGAYPRMDFHTRDRYRHSVEDIARRCPATEEDVARAAITLAAEALKTVGSDAREAHVGYFLIGGGASRLKDGLQYRRPLRGRIIEAILNWPTAFYLFGIELITLALAAYLFSWLPDELKYLGLILFFLATEPAIALMNQLTIHFVRPCRLPKLDFSEGIPVEYRTMVVVPTLLLSEEFIEKLLKDLEVRFLANRDPQLAFALLTDFADAPHPVQEQDQRLEQFCIAGIRRLNAQYASNHGEPFYLFHRRREWNAKQSAWMGWERKRGKLIALNSLLRNQGNAFAAIIGDVSILPGVTYVITLDSDTELPRGTAQQLVGTMAHPLNRAVIDPVRKVVRAGYGILQPRVGISVHSARRSRLASIYSGQTGFDIYTTAVSDVYQDLFGEGSYVGKGIYDVDVFQATLSKRFPDDVLLSHDLIEGTHARAGLVSDIELIDDYPSHYNAWSKRKHRWVRGDWQIMHWLLPRVRDYHGRKAPNPLSIISLWKIVDNLRRSMLEIGIFVLLVAGWTFLPGGAAYWTIVVTAVSLLPVYLQAFFSLLRFSPRARWWVQLRQTANALLAGNLDVALRMVFLAHQMCLMLDAILRSIIRTAMTGRRLLEWESAAQAEAGPRRTVRSIDSYLWLATPLALATAIIIAFARPAALPFATPFLIAWMASPLIALLLNSSVPLRSERIGREDRLFLRGVALRTWQYFAEFGLVEDCRLVPDNVLEEGCVKAQRVSPTNIGLLLDAQLAARDFGYLSRREFLGNTESILGSLNRMERYRGHFFNWYDAQTLAALSPRYVSTVDSGNLAASLITLRQGLLEELKRPLIGAAAAEAVADHCRAILETAPESSGARRLLADTPPPAGDSVPQWRAWLESAGEKSAEIERENISDEARFWSIRLSSLIRSHLEDSDPELAGGGIDDLSTRIFDLIDAMDFSFLFDSKRKLLHIGYNVETVQMDGFEYGLLASEARTASFVAIAKNDIPQENWLRLGRTLIHAGGTDLLLSWSGTMFEYLMPLLWLKLYPDTLLDQTARGAVKAQQAYGAVHRIPWGVSESACAESDGGSEYRYYAFGVPGLRLNRGPEDHLVTAPYATILAMMIDPKRAIQNLRRQAERGWLTRYGFYEAVDFSRPAGQETVVKSFMAHHQGMSLLALDNALNRNCMQNRFHREPIVQSTELLLNEKLPGSVPVEKAPAALTVLPLPEATSQSAA